MGLSYTEQIGMAIRLVIDKMNFPDKSGEPSYLHALRVGTAFGDSKIMIAGILHDSIEDTDVSEAELRVMGFDDVIIDAVVVLTHPKNEPYVDYVNRIIKNPIAIQVKLEDLMDNMARLRRDKNKIAKKDADRMRNKWENALRILHDHLLRNGNSA